ncbi:MAG: T9SS type A sorting domain-containing protein [Ignavibacteriaceae bacterium]
MGSILRFSFRKFYLHRGVTQLVSTVSLIIFFSFFSNSIAQISITLDQVKTIFQPGQTHLFTNSDSTLKSVDIGKIGGPNVYDFSNTSLPSYEVSTNYYVSSLPKLALRYPSNSISMGISKAVEDNPVFIFGQDTLFVLGTATNTSPEGYKHYAPYQIFGAFPITFGYSASQSLNGYDTVFTFSGDISSSESFSITNTTEVDGYGTLEIAGHQVECLRIKLDHLNSDDKEFIYLTREGIFIDIDIPRTEPDTGNVSVNGMMVLLAPNILDVKEHKEIVPAEYRLNQNYPNPFNPTTTINYQVPIYSHVTIKLFDMLGKEIKTIVDENKSGGNYSVIFNAGNLVSGIYFYRIQAGSFVSTKKFVLLK